jgi:DNA-binding transcriptional regulator LsrR (DeoR family)
VKIKDGASPFPASGETPPGDERLLLATRVAWMSFVEGLRQEDIAAALGLNRMRVNRLLATAREEGLVRVEITSPHRTAAALEARLRRQFGLRDAVVVPSPQDETQVVQIIGHALAAMLNEVLRDGMTVGLHHGRVPHAISQSLKPANLPNLSTVSMKGTLTTSGRLIPYEAVARLALTLNASCYQLATPAYASSEEEQALFLGLPIVQSVLSRAASSDLALVTVSRINEEAGLVRHGFISSEEAGQLRSAGAVGAILGLFVDDEGQPIDHPVNRRRIGMDIDALSHIPNVILVGAERGREAALRAALRRGEAKVFITDERTATAILDE